MRKTRFRPKQLYAGTDRHYINDPLETFILFEVTHQTRHELLPLKMVEAKKFIYAQRFDGLPKIIDFELQSETLPELSDGGKSEN